MAPVSHVTLKNGPSKFDLMLALFDNKDFNRKVAFVGFNGVTYEAIVWGVEMSDETGELWTVRGRVKRNGVGGTVGDGRAHVSHPTFVLSYSTQLRTGQLEIDA
ncbi:MAG TPA: hypothetical protein VN665_01215 [Candidatus Paceibacterota bacterium]|nr:hypothetical protein [Candidatus Paceibacterota bacterium]